jgi:hypothetical protein
MRLPHPSEVSAECVEEAGLEPQLSLPLRTFRAGHETCRRSLRQRIALKAQEVAQ